MNFPQSHADGETECERRFLFHGDGLSIDVSERNVKEAGIRKVLGASLSDIVRMLSKDFLRLVAIAFALAIPLTTRYDTVVRKFRL